MKYFEKENAINKENKNLELKSTFIYIEEIYEKKKEEKIGRMEFN